MGGENKMGSIRLIKQQDETDCGVACLAMILNHYGTDIPLYKLREFSGTNLEGTSAFGLKQCVEALNFDCQAIQADHQIWKEKDFSFPVIAHIMIDNAYMHYVVVYGVQDNLLLIADPGNGKLKKSIENFCKEWTGVLLLMTPNVNYQPKKERAAGLNTFVPMLWQEKSLIFHIVLASLFISLFGIVSSYYFQGILDFFIPSKALSPLNIVSIGLIIIYLFRTLLECIRNYLLVILGQNMSSTVMLGYFKHVLTLPMNFFTTRKSGEIISRFLDANKIIDALANATLSIFLDIGMVLLVGVTLAIQNHTLFLITLVSLPFYLISIFSFVRSYEKANSEELATGANLNSSIIESLKGIETIKAYNGEERVYTRVSEEFILLMNKSLTTATLDNVQQGIKKVIQLISSALILWLGSYYVIAGKISMGQLITYNALSVFFTDPLQNIINLQVKIQTAHVANKRLNEILSIEAEDSKKRKIQQLPYDAFHKGIHLNNVSFSYNMNAPTLKGITCSIPAGSNVSLVGVSGSGKSTLAKLLVNFYRPSEGTIQYGQLNIEDINYQYLRNRITYIPQDSFFFSGTILENLSFGLESIPPLEKITEVCEKVQLTEFISKQPLQLETHIEEGGVNLSGGQRQRLAIARALLKDAEILILDEATSGLDLILEHEILKNLLQLTDKTLILITHSLSIAKSCDQIFVMNEGQLVEKGSHSDLRYNQGIYQQLWEI